MNLLASTYVFSFYTLISRVLGYIRDILIAVFLGASVLADAFFVAFRIPNTFRRLFAEGTFNAAFIPSYTSEKLKSTSNGKKFADDVISLLLIILLAIIFIVEIFTPYLVYLIAPGFYDNSEKFGLAVDLTRITFPFLLFVSLSSFFSGVLNSNNKFAAASAAPIILNIILILTLLIAYLLKLNFALSLSYGVTLSGIIQLIFLIIFSRKYYKPSIVFKSKINSKVKFFFKKLLPSIFSSGVTQVNILVGTIIASFEAGAVSYLYYADRIYQINLAIAGIAIGVVILPQLSKHIQSRKKNKILLIQNKALELSLFLSLPATIALIIGSEQIISALFGYGSFNENSVSNSSLALYYFALGLPAFALIKVFSSFFFANHDTKTPFYISLISVLVNIFISLYYFSEIGFIIIPIATSISSWFNSILLFLFLKNRQLFYFNQIFFIKFIKIIFASIMMGLFFNFMLNFFQNELAFNQSIKSFYLVLSVILGLLFYLIVCYFIKAFQMNDIKLKY